MKLLLNKIGFTHRDLIQITAIGVILFGITLIILACNKILYNNLNYILHTLSYISAGFILYCLSLYWGKPAGIKNDGVWFKSVSSRKWLAWLLACMLTVFYCILYWYPAYLGFDVKGNTGFIAFFDPLSYYIKNQPASQWFVYGLLYTWAIFFFGIKFIIKYRHSRYQILRTLSVMFFQTAFAFILPELMLRMNLPYHDFKNIWPLNYYFFDGWHIDQLLSQGEIGYYMLMGGILMIIAGSPILTFLFGKRWYCSWICGCGGLAETAGDSFRQLSNKSKTAWNMERILIYSILVFVIVMTYGVIYTYLTGEETLYGYSTAKIRSVYGFAIGAAFSGVIGVGFYPLMGSRVWCRFGCPMAAILGIQQRFFSRFRITTNGGQCISCGNCSSYCEMGIDVRSYAQNGKNIVRASCVGCGICAAVCPRGVLKLENGTLDLFSRDQSLAEKFK